MMNHALRQQGGTLQASVPLAPLAPLNAPLAPLAQVGRVGKWGRGSVLDWGKGKWVKWGKWPRTLNPPHATLVEARVAARRLLRAILEGRSFIRARRSRPSCRQPRPGEPVATAQNSSENLASAAGLIFAPSLCLGWVVSHAGYPTKTIPKILNLTKVGVVGDKGSSIVDVNIVTARDSSTELPKGGGPNTPAKARGERGSPWASPVMPDTDVVNRNFEAKPPFLMAPLVANKQEHLRGIFHLPQTQRALSKGSPIKGKVLRNSNLAAFSSSGKLHVQELNLGGTWASAP